MFIEQFKMVYPYPLSNFTIKIKFNGLLNTYTVS